MRERREEKVGILSATSHGVVDFFFLFAFLDATLDARLGLFCYTYSICVLVYLDWWLLFSKGMS